MTSELENGRSAPAKRPRRKLWKILFRLVISLVVIGIAAYAVANYLASRSISRQIAEIRAAGDPLTFADLEQLAPKVDPDKDSGPFYTAAMALVREVDREKSPEKISEYDESIAAGHPTPAVLAEMQRRTEFNQLALDMLDRAAKLPQCGYDFELRYGISVMLPKLNRSRSLLNAATLRTQLLAFQGNGDQASASAVSSIRYLRIFDRQPVLVAALVRFGSVARICDSIVNILESARPTESALSTLDQELAPVEQHHNLQSVYKAERVYTLEIARNIINGARDEAPAGNGPSVPEGSNVPGAFGRLLLANTLPVHAQFISAAAKGWPDLIDAGKAIAAEPRSRWGAMATILSSSFSRTTITAARSVAVLRATRIAIQIERYRLANGKLPETLNELPAAAQLPTDPFTNQPMVYKKTADAYYVYALGEERRDAGPEKLAEDRGPNWGIRVRTLTTQPAP